MAVLPLRISETARQRLGVVLWILHWICAVCGLSIISVGLYIKIRIEDKVNLIEGYNGGSLYLMLIAIGAITAGVDLAGGKLCHDVADLTKRPKLKSLVLPYIFVLIILNVCIFAAGCMCFAHRIHLHQSFNRGLTKAMNAYKNNKTAKFEFDELQINFECCGNNGYEDWFNIQWISNDYLDQGDTLVQRKMADGRYLNDDTPYSCCNPHTARPCVHHHVHDNNRHFNYDYRTGLTLHEQGCKKALMEYFTARLNRIGSVVMVIFILQFVMTVLIRYLQTSIKNAYDLGYPEKPARGWLFARIEFWLPAGEGAERGVSFTEDEDDDSSFGINYDAGEPLYENAGIFDNLQLPERPGKSKKSSDSTKKKKGRTDSKKSKNQTTKSKGSTKKSPAGSGKKTGSSTKKKSPGATSKGKSGAKNVKQRSGQKSKSVGKKPKSVGKKPKTRMKSKNNNIDYSSSYSEISSNDSDGSQTPLLPGSSDVYDDIHYYRSSLPAQTGWLSFFRRAEPCYAEPADLF